MPRYIIYPPSKSHHDPRSSRSPLTVHNNALSPRISPPALLASRLRNLVGLVTLIVVVLTTYTNNLFERSPSPAIAADPPQFVPPTYRIPRTGVPIVIDGQLDEVSWFAAPSASEFHFTWYKSGQREQSVAKLLWDDENLYVGHVCHDSHITARIREHDGPIPKDDCFEVIFAPDPKHPEVYFNLEWNVIGGYLDNFRPNGPNKPRAPVWDAEGVEIAGKYVGTLNDDSDVDQYWTVEVRIPLKNFREYMPHMPPQAGAIWNLNFNRHGGDFDPQYSQWSPADTPNPNFHTPHRFGRVEFSETVSPFQTK